MLYNLCAILIFQLKGKNHDGYGNQSIIDQYDSHAIH